VRASPPTAGVDHVRLAGEPEREFRRARATAVPVDATTWRQILDAGASLGIERAAIERLAQPR
jgi:uncharacterized oxidoreductase